MGSRKPNNAAISPKIGTKKANKFRDEFALAVSYCVHFGHGLFIFKIEQKNFRE